MHINSTQVVGSLTFAAAAVASAVASRTLERARPVERRYWQIFAAIYLAAGVEVIAGLRHWVTGAVADWLKGAGIYPDRRPAQVAMVLVAAAIVGAVASVTVVSAPTKRLSVACTANLALTYLFFVELISLHATDAVLYYPAGPVLLIGWLWLVCGSLVIVIALSYHRSVAIGPLRDNRLG